MRSSLNWRLHSSSPSGTQEPGELEALWGSPRTGSWSLAEVNPELGPCTVPSHQQAKLCWGLLRAAPHPAVQGPAEHAHPRRKLKRSPWERPGRPEPVQPGRGQWAAHSRCWHSARPLSASGEIGNSYSPENRLSILHSWYKCSRDTSRINLICKQCVTISNSDAPPKFPGSHTLESALPTLAYLGTADMLFG